MILVGQSLELARPPLLDAVNRRATAPIVARAHRQVRAGAQALDLNSGMRARAADLAWAVRTLRDAGIDAPLWLDAAEASTLVDALDGLRDAGALVANAWAIEDSALLGAVASAGTGVVISPRHADDDAPTDATALASMCARAVDVARTAGVTGAIYLDALAWPPAFDGIRCRRSLAALRAYGAIEDVTPLVAVGNVSAGVERDVGAALRRVYAAAAAGAGAGALILPVEEVASVRGAQLACDEAFPRGIEETYLAALQHSTAHGEQPAPPPAGAGQLLREAWRMIFVD